MVLQIKTRTVPNKHAGECVLVYKLQEKLHGKAGRPRSTDEGTWRITTLRVVGAQNKLCSLYVFYRFVSLYEQGTLGCARGG